MSGQRSPLRGTLAGAAAVATLIALAGCGTSPGDADGGDGSTDVVASGVSFSLNPGGITNLSEYVGIDMGFYEKHGIVDSQVVSATSGSTTLQLLQAGQLDFGAINIPSTILAEQASGVDLRVAVGMMTKFPVSLVCNPELGLSDRYPESIEQLAGSHLKIGTTAPASSGTTYLQVTLLENGIDLDEDVEIIFIEGGVAPMVTALKSNALDCIVVFEPTQTVLGDTVTTLFDVLNGDAPQVLSDASYNVLTVTGKYAEENPEVIAAVQNAMVEIHEYLADPANAREVAEGVAARYPDFTVDELADIIERLAPLYVNSSEITQEQYDACIEVFNINNEQTIDVPYGDVILPLP